MPFGRWAICLYVWAAFSVLSPRSAEAVGLYQDYNRFSSFLLVPAVTSIDAGATRTRMDSPAEDAAIYTLSARLPLRTILFQLELPYASLATKDDIQNAFGDLTLRIRFTGWAPGGKALWLLSGVRLGAAPFLRSSAEFFPYSTGSLDFEAGLAYVDTMEAFTVWVASVATHPTRVDDVLKDSNLYKSYLTIGAGVAVTPGPAVALQAGAIAYFPRGHSIRHIHFVEAEWRYSQITAFYGFAQIEAGDEATRATDIAAGLGTRITF